VTFTAERVPLVGHVLLDRDLLTLSLTRHLGSPLLWHLVHRLLAVPLLLLHLLLHCVLFHLSLRWMLLRLVAAIRRLITASMVSLIAPSFAMATPPSTILATSFRR